MVKSGKSTVLLFAILSESEIIVPNMSDQILIY